MTTQDNRPFRHQIPFEIEEILESTGQYDRLVKWLENFTEDERAGGYNAGAEDGYSEGFEAGYDEAKRDHDL